MKFYIPSELTDPMVRDGDRICHGDSLSIDVLAAEVEKKRVRWLEAHPGWTYTGTELVHCFDKTPSPAYDVLVAFRRPRTPEEREAQTKEREAYVAHKEEEYYRREAEQKALLEEVLASLKRP